MKKLIKQSKKISQRLYFKIKEFMKNTDGDQITGWLIVILLVVVVGAFFLNTYQTAITDIWEAIVDKIYDTFGI